MMGQRGLLLGLLPRHLSWVLLPCKDIQSQQPTGPEPCHLACARALHPPADQSCVSSGGRDPYGLEPRNQNFDFSVRKPTLELNGQCPCCNCGKNVS